MTAKSHVSWLTLFVILALLAIFPLPLFAQCYLSQGCKPVDDLTYIPNGTGQVYHGDGASNNGAGGWTSYYSDVNQCLSCHYGTDTYPYLMTGHKNTLRKFAPGTLWGGPDDNIYLTTDDYYGSGSTYNWMTNQVTLGWCDPLGILAFNGLTPNDPGCVYPYYTLPNAHAPAPYNPVGQTVEAGGVRNLFYLYGGWQNYGGSQNPAATHLNTVFDSGFTGDLYPKNNFDCSRCHATGYNFDSSAPEPTSNLNEKVTWIPDAQLGRLPSDGFVAPGTKGTSSWYLTGIQCERCHVAAWGSGSHPEGGLQATIVYNEAATALCMECHRAETIVPANPGANPPIAGSISPANTLTMRDLGYCSDLSGASYDNCLNSPSNQWIYKPYIDHEAGQSFLNGAHGRFSGSLIQNAQHSADLSITIAGAYASQFTENLNDPTKNLGCVGCHDPHQSVVPAAGSSQPFLNTCTQCHTLSKTIMGTINHPMGPGTPFPTGGPSDIPGACITCHMQAALGTANSHLFRISSDPNYRTFPTVDQFYNDNINTLGIETEYSEMDGSAFAPASWLDVDLACGQCHVGNDGVTNEYGLTMPAGMPGSHAYTRAQLAYWASVMHGPDPSVPAPAFSPAPTTYHSPQTITISDATKGAMIYYTTDGSLPTKNSPVYSGPITVASTTSIYAMATYPYIPNSAPALATYSIVLPQAPQPTFSPTPSTFSGPQSVKLSNTLNLQMYYTTDGSTPTAGSTPYASPIAVNQNTTIKAITIAYGYINSTISTGSYIIQAPNPTFSPAAGTYYTPQTVTISDSASGSTIYYTTDGSFPSTSSTSCVNPCKLTVSITTTLKAIASGGGYGTGNVAVAVYTIAANTPTFSPASGSYSKPLAVTISDTTTGVTIYYTTDGSFPTTSSASCPNPCNISLTSTATVKAIAAGNGISQSGVGLATYTLH